VLPHTSKPTLTYTTKLMPNGTRYPYDSEIKSCQQGLRQSWPINGTRSATTPRELDFFFAVQYILPRIRYPYNSVIKRYQYGLQRSWWLTGFAPPWPEIKLELAPPRLHDFNIHKSSTNRRSRDWTSVCVWGIFNYRVVYIGTYLCYIFFPVCKVFFCICVC